jgi:hypothetical protein
MGIIFLAAIANSYARFFSCQENRKSVQTYAPLDNWRKRIVLKITERIKLILLPLLHRKSIKDRDS